MIRSAFIAALAGLSAFALISRSAAADDDLKQANKTDFVVPGTAGAAKKDDGKPKEGWSPRLALGATASFGDNRSVVGQTDGGTLAFGLKFDVGLDYRRGGHEWRNTLNLAEGMTRTPVIPVFVKSVDQLAVESIYLYHVTPWFGPFARATMLTSMFRGADIRPAPVTYEIARVTGEVESVTASRLTLSEPFHLMTLKQSLGPFLRPVEREMINVEIRAGLGAQETIAKGQLAITDDDSPEIEVKELANVNQLGVQAAADVWGTISDKRVIYRVGVDVMLPLLRTSLVAGDNRSTLDLMNVEMGGQLSFKLVEWASLDYQIKAIREPQVLDAFQVRNSLLLTLGLSYTGEKK
ncbi:MAG: hypothetical protein ABI134_30545 [Byssovorax sp.]